MNKKVLFLVVGLGLVVVFGWEFLGPKIESFKPTPPPKPTQVVPIKASSSVDIIYDKVSKHSDTQTEGVSALELLKKVTDGKVVTKGEAENAFVTSIDGRVASDAKREFWALYVNGKLSDVGAGSYIVKNGDKIKWQIDKY